MEFIRDYADWFYLIGAVLFILTLRGLSGPKTAIAGNRSGMSPPPTGAIQTQPKAKASAVMAQNEVILPLKKK